MFPIPRRRLLVASAAASLGAPWLAARAAERWLIGQSAPHTGVLAASSAETTAGAALYFRRLNAGGGVHGRPVELVSLDDGQDPKRTVENTQALIDRGALALAMYRTTPSIEATLPLVRKAGIPFVASQVGPSVLYDQVEPLVFNTRASYHDEVARVVRFFGQLGIERVAALAATDAFGQDVLRGLTAAMAGQRLTLVAQASLDNRSAEVAAQVELIRQAQPQVVLLISNARAAAGFVKTALAARFRPTFVSLSNTSSASYVGELGAAAEGVVVTQVVPSPYSGRVRAVAEFREALGQAGADTVPLSHASLMGWLNARFLHEAIRRAGPGADRSRLVAAIEQAGRFDLGDFVLSYSPQSRHGSRLAELTMVGSDGRFRH